MRGKRAETVWVQTQSSLVLRWPLYTARTQDDRQPDSLSHFVSLPQVALLPLRTCGDGEAASYGGRHVGGRAWALLLHRDGPAAATASLSFT